MTKEALMNEFLHISQIPLVCGYHDVFWDDREIEASADTDARRAMRIVGTKASRRRLELEGHEKQLLPGIPDDLVFELVTPKLSWRDFPILASVSKAWFHAVQSGLFFHAIVHCHSTETLVLLCYEKVSVTSEVSTVIALYSQKENLCFQVPPNPCHRDGLPLFCQFVALDGKIYVVGGTTDEDPSISSEKVYIFDLAGKKEWKECASMKEPRANFGCGVFGGKIYTFGGGMGSSHTGRASEVYDPTTNIWSPIVPMLSSRSHHNVSIVGGELVDQCGYICEVYNPVKNKWRATDCSCYRWESMYPLNLPKIGERWFADRLNYAFAPFWPPDNLLNGESWPAAILVVNGVLLMLTKYRENVVLLQCSTECGKITWHVKGELPFSAISSGFYRMQSIEL